MLPDGFTKAIAAKDMVKIFIQSLFFLHSRPFAGGLWFFGALFYTTIFYAIQEYFLHKVHLENFHCIFSICYIFLGYYLVKGDLISHFPRIKYVCIILFSESMFTIGTLINRYDLLRVLKKINRHIGLLVSFIILLFLQYRGGAFAGASIVNPFFLIVASISGFSFMYFFAHEIQNIKMLKCFFTSVGIHTVPILALHTLCFKIITFIQLKIFNVSGIYLSLYPVYKNSLLWCLLYVLVGVSVPYCIALLLSKNYICKHLLKM